MTLRLPIPARLALWIVLALLLAAAPALAVGPAPDRPAAAELDRAAAAGPDAGVAASLERLRTDPALRALGSVAHVDERYGVPNFVWANAAAPLRTTAGAPASRAEAARAHLGAMAPLYGLDAHDVAEAPLRYLHDTGRGGVIATFTQRVDGIDVFRDELKVLMDRSGRLLATTGYIPSQNAAGRGAARAFALTAVQAVGHALDDFAGVPVPKSLRAHGAAGGYDLFAPGADLATAANLTPDRDVRAKQVYFHLGSTLVPGWYVELMGPQAATAYVISAADGSLLFRHSLMQNDVFNYRVWAGAASPWLPTDGPQGTAPTPHPTGLPDYYNPPYVASSLVALQNSPFSNNDPWLAAGATQTTGNNADTYADLASPDGFTAGDLRATTTSANTFDRTYNPTLAPSSSTNQRMAAVTQLFFLNNFLHDWYYDSGFDEASGNAQANNYGRGGVGGDPILAEADDFGGTNNANMATPADGGPPRMQMYVFTGVASAKVTVTAPAWLAGDKGAGTAAFGPTTFNLTNQVVLASPNDGCSAIGAGVVGKIALIDRGTCTFAQKAQNAQAAGAIGVLIANNVANSEPPGMAGSGAITIPVLSITKELGDSIKTALGSGTVTVTMIRQSEVDRDGTIDNQIVAHEWGHYISNRLVGNGGGLTNNQGGGMGEGWGDFHAMLLTVRPEDAAVPSNPNFAGVYAMAGYATGSSFSKSYYYGIRRLPYSTDMTRNGLTFRHISNGQALPAGVPTAFGTDGANNAEVHNTGEVWCTMLWECYAGLLRDTGRLTFDQARARMKDYLVAAYKLTPNAPTFVEARDAVIAAAAANDPADAAIFWTAFAKRGIGSGAVAPARTSTDNTGVVESFTLAGDATFVSASVNDDISACDHDGYLDEGETGTLTVTLRNVGAATLTSTSATVSSTNAAVSFPSGNVMSFPASSPYANTATTLPIKLQGAPAGPIVIDLQITYGDPGQIGTNPENASLNLYGRANEVASTTETAEERVLPWTATAAPPNSAPWQRLEVTSTDHRLYGPDAGVVSDIQFESPSMTVAGAGNFTFTFSQAYKFERSSGTNWDGGVIEISTDGGGSWIDIGASASPGYNGVLSTTASNPLGGRSAYCGTSTGYPATQLVTVNLGTAYAGQTVKIRFRIGTDEATGSDGWKIDNIAFTNLTNTPYMSVVGDPNVCAPTAVGDDLPTELAFAVDGAMPVRGDARLRFALPTAAHVEIAVFDIAGRKVATLADGAYEAGRYSTTWKRGASGGSGVYFARMTAGGRTLTQRVLALR